MPRWNGTTLRDWRQSRGLSQGQLARELHLSRGSVVRMETGKLAVRRTTYLACLGIDVLRVRRATRGDQLGPPPGGPID